MAGRAPSGGRLKRSVLTCAAALAGAFVAAPVALARPAGAFGTSPTWMIRSTAINLIDGYLGNDALTQGAFDDFSTLETSAPHSWLSQSVQTYDAYGPATTSGTLLYALENGKVPPGTTDVLYDDEAWAATPVAEQQDPGLYMSLFVQAAHDYGYGAILAPAVDLTTAMPCYKPSDADWANYLDDCDIPQIAADADPDVFEVQSQRYEDDLSSASDCDCFSWFVDQAALQASGSDPYVDVYAGLASDHEGVVSTPQNLYQDTLATENDVGGYWLNVPQQSGACPSCTPGGAPQVAAGYLWLLGYEGNGSQAISMTAPGGAVVGGATTLAATGGPSGNPVQFSVDPSSTPGACSLSGLGGRTLTYSHAGACVIDATQAGATDWDPAPEVQSTVDIGAASQAIEFPPPAAGTVGGIGTASATGGPSANPVVFSVDPSSGAGVCSVSGPDGATISYSAAGSCVLDANEAGDTDYLAAPQVTQTVEVGPGAQSISLGTPPPAAVGGTATLTATGGASGNPVVFSVDPSSGAGVCSVAPDGATVTYTAAGPCVLDANEAGSADWDAAAQVSETIGVAQGSETLQFPAVAGNELGQLPAATVGTSAALSAAAGPSTSPVVFSIDPSSDAGVCNVSGSDGTTLTFTAVGNCVVDANQAGDANWLAAPEQSETISVGPGAQSIDFTAPATAAVGISLQLSASGGGSTSPVVFSVDPSSDSGACAVAGPEGATLTFTGVGSCVVDANQAADADYDAASEVVRTVTVGQGSQSISFLPPASALYGTSTSLTAGGGGSGNRVAFSVDPSSGTGVCTLSPDGSTLSFTAVGTCVVDANQDGSANYAAAPQVTETIAVALATQSIDLPAPAQAFAGQSATLVGDGGGSGNPVAFSVDASSGAGVCSLSGPDGDTLSFAAVGTCVVDANQAGDSDFLPAPQVSESFEVQPGTQSITLGPAPSGAVGTSTTLVATGGGSTSPVVFSVDPSSGAGVCSVSGPEGTVLAFTAVGTCVVDANQAADANYQAAPQVGVAIGVGPGAQAIDFAAPASGAVGSWTVLAATGGASGNPVVFSVDPSSGAGVCSVSGPEGDMLAYTAVGSCVVDAEQAASTDWAAAPMSVSTVSVGPGSQSISLQAPATGIFGTTLTLSATGGPSTSPVVFTVDPASGAGVCSISAGATLSLTGTGSCVVDADQAADANWLAAPQVSAQITVAPAAQEITFTTSAPIAATYGGSPYTVSAQGGGSGNPVTFSSATPSVCAVGGSTVSFVGVGTCTIDAAQGGTADWSAAAEVSQSFTVVRAPQSIAFTSAAPAGADYASPAYTVAATGGPSGRPVTLTSATASVCTLSGASVSFVGVGTCTLDANQQGNNDFAPAPQASQSFDVGQATQSVTITSSAPASATYAGHTYTIAATGGGSGNPVTYTSARTTVCTVDGAVVSFVGVGTCTVDAAQAGNADYAAAPTARQSFVVHKSGQYFTITSKAPTKATDGGAKYTVTSTTGASKLPVLFTSATTSVCTVSGAVVSFVGVGTCTIDANEASNAEYYAAPQEIQGFTVAK